MQINPFLMSQYLFSRIKKIHCLPVTLGIYLVYQLLQMQQIFMKTSLESGLNNCSHWRKAHSMSSTAICSFWPCQNLKTHHVPSEAPDGGFCSSSDEVGWRQPKVSRGRELKVTSRKHSGGEETRISNTNYEELNCSSFPWKTNIFISCFPLLCPCI